MKLTHIILIISIAVAIGVIVSMNSDAGTYGTFKDAKLLASAGKQTTIQVIGELTKDEEGNITGIVYEPSLNPNRFQFQMIDTLGVIHTVVYGQPKPQDFEQSEKIVVSGTMKEDYFKAEKILMKCPSKYKDEAEFKEA